jgi:hypothetical protein
MQLSARGEKLAVGTLFDSDMSRIDDALALALMYGLDGKRETRVVAMSISRPSLPAAAFCDEVARFYAGAAAPFLRMLPIGLQTAGKPVEAQPMLEAATAKPDAKNIIKDVKDTADPAALIRNALLAQHDGNALIVLAGPAMNLSASMALPGVKDLIAKKVRMLVIRMPDVPDLSMGKLLADWPTPIVFATSEIGQDPLYPAISIEADFAWAKSHPVVEAYRAYKPMPYDAPTSTMAAVLYAIRPQDNFFRLSDPGTLTIQPGGKLELTPSAEGKHRQLLPDPSQRERLSKVYIELASAKPVPRMPRFRQQQQQEKKPEKPAPGQAKPSGV